MNHSAVEAPTQNTHSHKPIPHRRSLLHGQLSQSKLLLSKWQGSHTARRTQIREKLAEIKTASLKCPLPSTSAHLGLQQVPPGSVIQTPNAVDSTQEAPTPQHNLPVGFLAGEAWETAR